MLKSVSDFLEQQSRLSIILMALGLVLVLGFVDYRIGAEISFSVFYVMPISLVSWYIGRRAGITVSVYAAIIWLVADLAAQPLYSHFLIPYWNSLVRLAFFLIVAFLLAAIKKRLELEEQLADTDYLTGLKNSRAFYKLFETEAERSRRYRHPLTIAYIDLDNFKLVNDTHGHEVGDRALKITAQTIRDNLRSSDVISRLGGDEFVCLFPETGLESSEAVINNILPLLRKAMIRNDWPITFSIGVMTFKRPMEKTREMIKSVDDLMYHVKKRGKNSVNYRTWP